MAAADDIELLLIGATKPNTITQRALSSEIDKTATSVQFLFVVVSCRSYFVLREVCTGPS